MCIRNILPFFIIWTLSAFWIESAAVASSDPFASDLRIKSEGEILTLLDTWKSKQEAVVPLTLRGQIEKDVEVVPVVSSAQLPISYEVQESKDKSDFTLQINRRDYGYAACGFYYTLLGGSVAGEKAMLDAGFWCFIKAALLKPEAEHLTNVGFHLNIKGAYQDALDILLYARTLSSNHSGLSNNLAHAAAKLGYEGLAIVEEANAYLNSKGNPRLLGKIKQHIADAGYSIQVSEEGMGEEGEDEEETDGPESPDLSQEQNPSKYGAVFGVIVQEHWAFWSEYMGTRLMQIHQSLDMSDPGSAAGREVAREQRNRADQDACIAGCRAPDPGILKAGQAECECQCYIRYRMAEYTSGLQFYQEFYALYGPWQKDAEESLTLHTNNAIRALSAAKNDLSRQSLDFLTELILH
ncbi:hypothetical protein JXO59_15685, partial [candidate division KSB1 bacterium]|nr:hypothetical protein [candidate division KSB1 bacterium]